MGDQEDDSASATVPEWQRSQEQSDSKKRDAKDTGDTGASTQDVDIETTRRFLDHEDVRTAPRPDKIAFLVSKGIPEAQAQTLVDEAELEGTDTALSTEPNEATPLHTSRDTQSESLASFNDRPPIVTYPEFLTKPQRPPPLVTTNRLVGALNVFAALSAVIYGTSKFIVTPMVESLTESRVDLHDTTSQKLDSLVAKLEKTVSEIPPRKQTDAHQVSDDDDDDPAEMFHRDVGTQTFLPTTPSHPLNSPSESESHRQADRISSLNKSLSGLRDTYRAQSEDVQDLKTLLDVFRDDLDAMALAQYSDPMNSYSFAKRSRKEPEDEIRKARDNIRRVKGVLLSTRSFPASTRSA